MVKAAMMLFCAVLISLFIFTKASCPYLAAKSASTGKQYDLKSPHESRKLVSDDAFKAAFDEIDWAALKTDIKTLLGESKDFWPADDQKPKGKYYGPLMIRFAWHCAGSWRRSDGRGGCDGARIRFDPERSWEDNANLDKARDLLAPLKLKYGVGLSWGDLITYVGNVAIEDMGGPILGFCAGRRDDDDATDSFELGPSPFQELVAPCPDFEADGSCLSPNGGCNGNCSEPIGASMLQLIYVNAQGFMGNPNPNLLVSEVRDIFARMGMNDSETVALIGGGHAFGRNHGACPAGPGPSPFEDEENPWPGKCGTGKGTDAWTSGFEGAWTTTPTSWDNEYFKNLIDPNLKWGAKRSPGGPFQWYALDLTTNKNRTDIMMLTGDVVLLYDESYKSIVELYANNLPALENSFKHAWYKLTTRDMGPRTRCMGDMVPPAQAFQYPLPDPLPASQLPDFNAVKKDIENIMRKESDIIPSESGSYGPLFVRLAWQCANPFRATDYTGGCNGARIRFAPQKDWKANVILDKAIQLLKPIKETYPGLSYADLIVLAGNVGLEAGAPDMGPIPFTGGRVDALESQEIANPFPDFFENRLNGGDQDDTIDIMKDVNRVWGLTLRELVALIGGGHSLGRMHSDRSGFADGSWTTNTLSLDNEYFKNLLELDWVVMKDGTDLEQYKANKTSGTTSKTLYMLRTDMNLRFDAEYEAYAEEYASDNELFLKDFVSAWVKVMNADMFTATTAAAPTAPPTSAPVSAASEEDEGFSTAAKVGVSVIGGVVAGSLLMFMVGYWATKGAIMKMGSGPFLVQGEVRASELASRP